MLTHSKLNARARLARRGRHPLEDHFDIISSFRSDHNVLDITIETNRSVLFLHTISVTTHRPILEVLFIKD
jgi:hypothetical protein